MSEVVEFSSYTKLNECEKKPVDNCDKKLDERVILRKVACRISQILIEEDMKGAVVFLKTVCSDENYQDILDTVFWRDFKKEIGES